MPVRSSLWWLNGVYVLFRGDCGVCGGSYFYWGVLFFVLMGGENGMKRNAKREEK